MRAFEDDKPPLTPEAAKALQHSLSDRLNWVGRVASEPKPLNDPAWVFWQEIMNRSALVFEGETAWLVSREQADAVRVMQHIKQHGSIDYPDSPVFGFGKHRLTSHRAATHTYGLLELPVSFAGEILTKLAGKSGYVYHVEPPTHPAVSASPSNGIMMPTPPSAALTTLEQAIERFGEEFYEKARTTGV